MSRSNEDWPNSVVAGLFCFWQLNPSLPSRSMAPISSCLKNFGRRSTRHLCSSPSPRSARRRLGSKLRGAVTLRLNARAEVSEILSLAAAASVTRRPDASPARPAILAGIDLAKLAGRLPAVLIVDANSAVPSALVQLKASAVSVFRQQLIQSLSISGMLADPARGRGRRAVRGVSRRYSQRARCYRHRRTGFVLPRPRAHTFSLPDR